MNEGLEALERVRNNLKDSDNYINLFDMLDLSIIEKELKEAKHHATNTFLLHLLLDTISYCYYKTDGTYGDLALPVVDKVKYIQKVLYEHLPIETSEDKLAILDAIKNTFTFRNALLQVCDENSRVYPNRHKMIKEYLLNGK